MFQEELQILREKYQDYLVWYGFKYNGKVYFGLTKGKDYRPFDGSVFGVSVENGKCKRIDDYWALLGSDKKMAEAWMNRIKIDVQEDF